MRVYYFKEKVQEMNFDWKMYNFMGLNYTVSLWACKRNTETLVFKYPIKLGKLASERTFESVWDQRKNATPWRQKSKPNENC